MFGQKTGFPGATPTGNQHVAGRRLAGDEIGKSGGHLAGIPGRRSIAKTFAPEVGMLRTLLVSGRTKVEGITLERLDAEHSVRLNLANPFLPFAEGGFGGAEGKAQLGTAGLAYQPAPESRFGDEMGFYPLELITPKAHDAMNSTFGYQPALDAETDFACLVHEDGGPDDCEEASLGGEDAALPLVTLTR